MERQPLFRPGTRFKTQGKHSRVYTVKDIHRTYNLAGELVQLSYIGEREFMGQLIDYEVPETTISRGLLKDGE